MVKEVDQEQRYYQALMVMTRRDNKQEALDDEKKAGGVNRQ